MENFGSDGESGRYDLDFSTEESVAEDAADYRGLRVWSNSMELVVDIYKVTAAFPSEERFGLVSQQRRAAVSIPSNIAEGNARSTRGDYLRFLSIAQGSAAELETQVQIASRLDFQSDADTTRLLDHLSSIRRQLRALANALRP